MNPIPRFIKFSIYKLFTTLSIFLIATTGYAQTYTVERVVDGGEPESYVACGCGCCGGKEEPQEHCLYRSEGDDLQQIIAKDKKVAQSSECAFMGCSFPIKYIYCDEGQTTQVSRDQITTVERVIDGDTIVVTTPEGKSEEVQLIGIQALEDEKMGQPLDSARGKEATEFVNTLLDNALTKELRLEFDVKKLDKYGRTLAYVYSFVCRRCDVKMEPGYHYELLNGETYVFVNASIIKSGYATPLVPSPSALLRASGVQSREPQAKSRE